MRADPDTTTGGASGRAARLPQGSPGLRRLGWFLLLWSLGVASLTAIALPLRWLLRSV